LGVPAKAIPPAWLQSSRAWDGGCSPSSPFVAPGSQVQHSPLPTAGVSPWCTCVWASWMAPWLRRAVVTGGEAWPSLPATYGGYSGVSRGPLCIKEDAKLQGTCCMT
jgi:hypothetical protein